MCIDDIVRLPPFFLSEERQRPTIKTANSAHWLSLVLYEDDELLVINKPEGIAVHGGSGLAYGMIDILREIKPEWKNLQLVHRLDRGTSGCILLAKNRKMLCYLHELLKTKRLEKNYMALVKVCWEVAEKQVDAPIAKNEASESGRQMIISEQGKSACTIFRPQQVIGEMTLIEVSPITGRTHQIRVHAASLGYPIIGDDKYGDSAFNQMMEEKGHSRLFLHAKSITLPLADKAFVVSAPLGKTFTAIFADHNLEA